LPATDEIGRMTQRLYQEFFSTDDFSITPHQRP